MLGIYMDLLFILISILPRGFAESDFEMVAEFFDRAVTIAEAIRKQTGSKIKDFKSALENGPDAFPELVKLRNDVTEFARKFPTVGF
jgi:glycine hydroxymethyltransferase